MSISLDVKGKIAASGLRVIAREGLGRATLRAIVKDADVNVAAVNYYYGSRDRLLHDLFISVIEPINAARRTALDSERKKTLSKRLSVEGVLRAKYGPLFELYGKGDPLEAWRRLSVVYQIRQDPAKACRALLDEHDVKIDKLFDIEFACAMGVEIKDARRIVRLANGAAWDLVGKPQLAEELSRSKKRERLLDTVYMDYLAFSAAGMKFCAKKQTLAAKGV